MNAVKLIILSLLFAQAGFAQNSTNELNEVSNNSTIKGLSVNFNAGNVGIRKYGKFQSLNFVTKYRFNQHWALGLGTGVERFGQHGIRIPLFLEGEYHFTNNSFDPFIGLIGGYELSPHKKRSDFETNWGLTYGGKIGFNYFFSKHIGFSTTFGYRFAKAGEIMGCGIYNLSYRGIEGRLGLIIK